MMKKFFSGRKNSSAVSRPSSKRSNNGGSYNQSMTMANQVANSEAERQLFRFDMPTQQRGMTDLIASHQDGSRFQYVALTGADVEEHSSRIRRLIQLQPKVSKAEIPQKDLPRLRLKQDTEKFSLAEAIPVKGKEFIQLNRATVIFTPLSSFTDNYTTIKISLMDMRKRSDQERSSVKANTNVQAKMEFSLDYCVPREDVNQVFLLVNREQSTMNEGQMWGVLQVQLEIIETDYPFMENMREVVGVLSLPSSGLDKFDKDPQHLDITMHNNHRMKMQDLYLSGEIADETEPIKEKTQKMTYAKSSAPIKSAMRKQIDFSSPGLGGRSVLPEVHSGPMVIPEEDLNYSSWDNIKSAPKNKVADDIASFEVSEDGATDSFERPATPIKRLNSRSSLMIENKSEESLPILNPKRKVIGFKTGDV